MRGWGQSRRGWTAAALAVLALLALPAESRGQTTPGEQAAPAERKVKVRHIAIEGVLRVPAETLFGLIPIAEGMELSPLALEERIRQTVRNIFQMENFSDARIYKVDVEEGVIDLVVVVTEKFVVSRINLRGNDEITEEDIRKTYSIREGRPLDERKLIGTLRSIEELYQDKGFYLAEARYEVRRDEERRTAVIDIVIEEQAEVEVRKITFVGNEALTDEELKTFLQTREKGYLSFLDKGGLFLRYFFQADRSAAGTGEMEAGQFESWSATQDIDLQRLKWFYMTRGYVDVRLGQPRLAFTADRKGILVTIDVAEGKQYTVSGVSIRCGDPDLPPYFDSTGLEGEALQKAAAEFEALGAVCAGPDGKPLFDPRELQGELLLKEGERFDAENVMRDTQVLSLRYMDMGFASVNVSNVPALDREGGRLQLTYVIEKGNLTYIGNIEMSGNRTTADKVIRREMKLAEGSLFSQSLIERSKAMIYRLGFFERVEIRVQAVTGRAGTGKTDQADLVVEVKERDTGIFNVGAGFSSLESFLFQARISKNNFLGRGQTLSFQALVSSLRQIYMISFIEPYFFDTLWSFSFDLYDTATDYSDFTAETLGGNVSWGYRLWDDYYVYLTYKLEEVDTELGGMQGLTAVRPERLLGEGLTSSLRWSVAWDTRNNRIIPTEGFYNSVSFEWASPYLGGTTDFYRTYVNSRFYLPLFWNFTLRLNGTLGHVGSTSAAGVPMFERFFVGGIFSVRGFQRNSLSPTLMAASQKDPASGLVPIQEGGNKELIFNAEIEIPIFREMNIVGVVFLDAGNAFAESEALSLVELRTSTGFGFRWWSPMGPLRFEWGFPLAPRPDEESMVFEFTIGSAF